MNHGIADFDPGRETIGHDATGHTLQHRQQVPCKVDIAVIHLKRCGQLPFEAFRDLLHLRCVLHADHQPERAEHFFGQLFVGHPVTGRNLEQIRRGIASLAGCAQKGFDARALGNTVHTAAISVGNAIRQHGLGLDGTEAICRRLHKSICVRPVEHDRNARIGTELADAHRQTSRPTIPDFRATGRGCLRQNEHWIDASEFAEERDRFGTRGTKIKKRPPPGKASGEADGLDPRIRHKRFSDRAAASLHEAENARVHAKFFEGRDDCIADDFTGAGVRTVPLDDNRTPRSKRCRSVATSHRERQREIGCTEDGHRSDDPAAPCRDGDRDILRPECARQISATGRWYGRARLAGDQWADRFPRFRSR